MLRVNQVRFLLGIVLSAAIGFASCGASKSLQELPAETILFDVFHVNYAWGFDCGGCVVDAGGNVRRYDCRELRDSILSEAWRGREEELLARRYRMKDSAICHVEPDELAAMRALIREASLTPPSEEEQSGADAGGTKFIAYLYGETKGDPTVVLLATAGDFTREPSTAEADTLVTWLRRACACKDSLSTR